MRNLELRWAMSDDKSSLDIGRHLILLATSLQSLSLSANHSRSSGAQKLLEQLTSGDSLPQSATSIARSLASSMNTHYYEHYFTGSRGAGHLGFCHIYISSGKLEYDNRPLRDQRCKLGEHNPVPRSRGPEKSPYILPPAFEQLRCR